MKHLQENKGFQQNGFLTERFIFTETADKEKGNYFSHRICIFEHFTKNINKYFLNCDFYQKQTIPCEWAQTATERQMRAIPMEFFPARKTKQRFLCLTGSHSKFSLSNSQTKGSRGGKIVREGKEKSAYSTLNALIKYLNVVLTQHCLSASLLTSGTNSATKNELWSPARDVNGY